MMLIYWSEQIDNIPIYAVLESVENLLAECLVCDHITVGAVQTAECWPRGEETAAVGRSTTDCTALHCTALHYTALDGTTLHYRIVQG